MGSNHRALGWLRSPEAVYLSNNSSSYSSKNSEIDYINLISDEICKLIAEEIVSAKFFAVIADTISDKSRREQTS